KKASLAFSSPIAKASLLIAGTKHRRPRRLFQDVETVVGGAMIGVYHPHHSDTSYLVVTDPVLRGLVGSKSLSFELRRRRSGLC
ncbi:hypothetical protein A2U01_0068654, partial [Trifolium medium]|nr:hypothetical protein [Trifolium medium]